MDIKDFWLNIKVRLILFWDWLLQNKYAKKVGKFLLIFIAIWLLYLILKDPFIAWLQSHERLWSVIIHVKDQITNKTYLGLYYAGVTGAFIGLTMPVELISLYYFNNDYFFLWVIFVAVFGILTGLIIDYFIGRLLGRRFLQYVLKEKYEALENKADKFGGWLLFGLSLIVAPIDLFVLVYGGLRYPFKKMLKITILGQLLKFLGIYFFLDYFSKTTLPILSGLL